MYRERSRYMDRRAIRQREEVKGMSMHIAVVSVLTRRQEARMNEIVLALLYERGRVGLG